MIPESVYLFVGKAFVWASFIYATYFVVKNTLKFVLNTIGKYSKAVWIIVEYAHYRHKFKEWVKNKNRIKNHFHP